MGSVDEDLAYEVSGKLAYGCSDLSSAWPHGGTGLGLVGAVYLSPPSLYSSLPAEETNAAANVLQLGGDLVMGITLRAWDSDALAALFPNTTTSGGNRIISWPATTVGVAVSTLTNVVFTPNNPDHPAVVIYKAAPLLQVNAQLYLSAYRFLEFPALLVALPDASDRFGKMGKLSVLSL